MKGGILPNFSYEVSLHSSSVLIVVEPPKARNGISFVFTLVFNKLLLIKKVVRYLLVSRWHTF